MVLMGHSRRHYNACSESPSEFSWRQQLEVRHYVLVLRSHHHCGIARTAPLGIWSRANSLILDAALVVAALDAEVALLRPVWVPGVCDFPVLVAVLHTPANQLDRVS